MAFNPYKHLLFGTTGMFSVTNGAADLPATAPPGDFAVGDIIVSVGPGAVSGQPFGWQLTGVSGNNLTWTAIAISGGNSLRTTALPATLTVTDRNVIFTGTTGAVTLPAPSAYPSGVHLSMVNNASGSATFTGVSGGLTIVAGGHAQIMSNGTAFYQVA